MMPKFFERIQKILILLNEGLFERQEVMNLTFLSALAGESIFMLGPPGVAKSLIARRLKFAFRDAKSFEYLMHRFSTPDEVFGPISIGKLKSEDKLERVVDYYLPGSNIAFLDEIWKAGPSIQNTLLTIINEKIYRNGEQELDVDLFGLLAASNELPEKKQGLEALWDRFIIRVFVGGIKSREYFEEMIIDTRSLYEDNIDEQLKISKNEYHSWQAKRDIISVPMEVLELINHIRVRISKYNEELLENEEEENIIIYVSDRRWKKIINVLRTSAFLNNRKKVDLMDCFLIPHMLWETDSQIPLINKMVSDCIRFQGYTLNINKKDIEDEIKNLEKEVEEETQYSSLKSIKKLDVHDGLFFQINTPSSDCKIKRTDFAKLSLIDYKSIQLYNDDGKLAKMYDVKKRDDFSIFIADQPLELYTSEKKGKALVTKIPHDLLKDNWNERIENIKIVINERLQIVADYEKKDLKSLYNNLFAENAKANIIVEKIENIKVSLHQLIIKCDEINDYYNSIGDEEIIEPVTGKTRRSKRG